MNVVKSGTTSPIFLVTELQYPVFSVDTHEETDWLVGSKEAPQESLVSQPHVRIETEILIPYMVII